VDLKPQQTTDRYTGSTTAVQNAHRVAFCGLVVDQVARVGAHGASRAGRTLASGRRKTRTPSSRESLRLTVSPRALPGRLTGSRSANAAATRTLLGRIEAPQSRRSPIPRVPPVVEVDVDYHGRPGGPLRDPLAAQRDADHKPNAGRCLAQIVRDAVAAPAVGAAGLCQGFCGCRRPAERLGRITLKVTRDERRFTVEVVPDGEGLVSHAGAGLLAEAADRLSLTRAPSEGLAGVRERRGTGPQTPRGRLPQADHRPARRGRDHPAGPRLRTARATLPSPDRHLARRRTPIGKMSSLTDQLKPPTSASSSTTTKPQRRLIDALMPCTVMWGLGAGCPGPPCRCGLPGRLLARAAGGCAQTAQRRQRTRHRARKLAAGTLLGAAAAAIVAATAGMSGQGASPPATNP
jgi:hypothetical protein